MTRAALITLAALVVILGGFGATFYAWHQQNDARAFALGFPDTSYNWTTMHAQDRGCGACHGDHLAADVNRLVVARPKPELHGIFATSYGIPMRVEDCLICHGTKTSLPFAEPIHSLHLHSTAFANMGGNCNSCHVTLNGQLMLYDDETRYAVLNGVSTVPTPDFERPATPASAH